MSEPAVAMDPFLSDQVEETIRKTGCKPHRMISGAGHDAMILAEKIPTAMIFLRPPGGITRDPAESVAGRRCREGDRMLIACAEPDVIFFHIPNKFFHIPNKDVPCITT